MTAGRLGGWIAAALVMLGSGAALAAGDPAHGEAVFKQCKFCHIADDKKNKVGPYLLGVVGRPAGSVDGYHYSEAMKDSGLVWDEAALDKYLANPKEVVPGTKMAAGALPKEQDREDVIAYLKSLE